MKNPSLMYIFRKKTSSGVRHQVNFKKFLLSKSSNIVKQLAVGKKSFYGRGCGRITIGHKGGGTKKKFNCINSPTSNNVSLVISHFYNARRSSFFSLCYNLLSSKFFKIPTITNSFPGSFTFCYKTLPELKVGSFINLKTVPTGSIINNLRDRKHFKYIKSAGTFGVLVQKGSDSCKIKMPSGELKTFSYNYLCFIGSNSNSLHNTLVIGKAGRARLSGRRPHVRGVAMNPVDHPHGGQTSGGRPSVTPWGLPTKGKPTRKKKNGKI
jgi:large subunit ribosomal protein L2